ncbi:uncharacterized protein METZ01_LOCUS252748, partial [marine metagenome]
LTTGNIIIPDAGNIGSASDTDAIAVSSAGVVALSATTEASATTTAALTVAGGLGVAKDVWIGDDLVLDSDATVISFGDNQDVTLTHVADTGLTMAVTGNNDATLQINADVADATVAPFLILNRTSGSPADADLGGQIKFDMENDNNQQFTAAAVHSKATDVSDGTEDGQLLLQTMVAGTLATNMTIGETSVSFKVNGTAVANQGFAEDTALVFFQASAPTGWTKSTANTDKALRVTSGSGGGTGGSVAFETAFASQSVSGTTGATTLATSQIPSHSHAIRGATVASGAAQYSAGASAGTSSAAAGGGGSHTHSFSSSAIDLDVSYLNVIVCTKDA